MLLNTKFKGIREQVLRYVDTYGIDSACRVYGVGRESLKRWLNGQDKDELFGEVPKVPTLTLQAGETTLDQMFTSLEKYVLKTQARISSLEAQNAKLAADLKLYQSRDSNNAALKLMGVRAIMDEALMKA